MKRLSALLGRSSPPKPTPESTSTPTIAVPPPLDPVAAVQLAYRAVLRRNPDRKDLMDYAAELQGGHDLAWLITTLTNSDEFRALGRTTPRGPTQPGAPPDTALIQSLTEAPPMPVDTRCSPTELQALWDHLGATWARLGEADPLWSVMTEEVFRTEALGPRQRAAFYKSGEDEVIRMNAWLARAGIQPKPDAICAELGCGVGRITGSLARRHGRIRALDVSRPHMHAAQARMASEGHQNVEFVHVTGPDSLAALRDIDVFFSIIALQHSPPPIILDILARAFAALRPGGYAFFQVPTYALDYRYAVADHLGEIERGERRAMEVHFVSQRDILGLAHRSGLAVAEIQPDECIGNHERWISNTVLLVRPGRP